MKRSEAAGDLAQTTGPQLRELAAPADPMPQSRSYRSAAIVTGGVALVDVVAIRGGHIPLPGVIFLTMTLAAAGFVAIRPSALRRAGVVVTSSDPVRPLLGFVATAVGASLFLAFAFSGAYGGLELLGLTVGVGMFLSARLFVALRDNRALTRTLSSSVDALGHSEERLGELVNNSSDIITVVDENSVVQYITPAVTRLLGLKAEDVLQRPLAHFIHPEDVGAFNRQLLKIASGAEHNEVFQFRIRHRLLSWRTLEATPTNLLWKASVQGIVLNTRDITERQALEKELRHQAFHDPLTNLANRSLLQDRLEQALRRQARTHDAVALILIDLDDFKTVNDSLGHAEGDALLRSAATRMVKCLRDSDTAARLGGDEFAILLEGAREHLPAAEIGNRILRGLEQPIRLSGQSVTIGASMGIAISDAGSTATDLLRRADVAMYRAKALGKGRCVIFDASMEQVAHERLQFQTELERALHMNELVLHYQPIIDLETGEIDGCEALIRWQHPERGLVPPGDFIPFAESSGLIIPMSTFVLREACAQGRRWNLLYPEKKLQVSVNISARHLQSPGFIDDVLNAVRVSRIQPELLILELTETAVLGDVGASVAKLDKVKQLGVRIALDDFGTGYSSLGYLRELPIDIVKIDRSFLLHVTEQQEHAELVRAIQTLSASLALNTTAEGVETVEQLAVLRGLHVDHAQGFLFSRPVDSVAMGQLLSRGRFDVGDAPVIARIASA